MVPNKEHCGWEGALGEFDVGAELKRWVDTDVAPERIIISGTTENGGTRTRPLCPHPQVATFTGTGSIDDAANFSCNAP
jgi:feruloyl esterase